MQSNTPFMRVSAGAHPRRLGKESFNKVAESVGYPIVKSLAIFFLVIVVNWATLAASDFAKIGLFHSSTEAADIKKENVPVICELKKGKEFIKKKRLNAQEWAQKGIEYLGSKKYEDARKAFGNAIEINEGFLQLFNRAAAMHMRYGNQNGMCQ
jgi:tetratricopeptide (TPR) repeat protein